MKFERSLVLLKAQKGHRPTVTRRILDLILTNYHQLINCYRLYDQHKLYSSFANTPEELTYLQSLFQSFIWDAPNTSTEYYYTDEVTFNEVAELLKKGPTVSFPADPAGARGLSIKLADWRVDSDFILVGRVATEGLLSSTVSNESLEDRLKKY